MAIEYFCCYHSYLKKCEKLSDQELGRLFRALMKYSESGESQELPGRESIAFDFISDDIDRAKRAYAEKCEANSINGKKGGRPRKSDTENPAVFSETQESQNKSKAEDENKAENKNKDYLPSAAAAAPAREREEKNPENPDLNRVLTEFRKNIPSPSPTSVKELTGFVDSLGAEVCLRAIYRAADAGVMKWTYIRGILRSCERENIRSLADWDKQASERESAKYSRGSGQKKKAPEQTESAGKEVNENAEYLKKLFEKMGID